MRPNPANRQPASKPLAGRRMAPGDLLFESVNGIITHHLNQFPVRPQVRRIALRSGSFRYWN